MWFCAVLRFKSPIGYPWTLNIYAFFVTIWLFREIQHYRVNKPNDWLEWAGKWSYSIYIVHVPVTQLLLGGREWPNIGYVFGWALFMLYILATSYLFYLLFEYPSHQLARVMGKYVSGGPSVPIVSPVPAESQSASVS